MSSDNFSISFDAVSAVKVNVTVKRSKSLYTPGRRIRGVELQFHSLLTSAPDGGEWSASRFSRFTSVVDPVVTN